MVVVVALVIVSVLLIGAAVLLVRAIPERIVGALSTEDSIAELRAAVKDLTEAATIARQSADRLERATKEEEA